MKEQLSPQTKWTPAKKRGAWPLPPISFPLYHTLEAACGDFRGFSRDAQTGQFAGGRDKRDKILVACGDSGYGPPLWSATRWVGPRLNRLDVWGFPTMDAALRAVGWVPPEEVKP